MSALAARRAALAAKAATPQTTPAMAAPPPRHPTPPASPTPSLSLSESDGDAEPQPSKRRKLGKASSPPSRYFVAPEEAKPKQKRSKRQFSPSAPQESGEDSSDQSDSDGEAEEVLGTGAITPWSGAPSPRVPDVGPSRLVSTLLPCSSQFTAEDGVNVFKVLPTKMSVAGISDDPGMVISIGEEENLAIAGTFKLTPLQNSVTLLSTTLRPGDIPKAYPVFCPTSHPVAVLAPAGESATSALLGKLGLPKTFHKDASRTVFLIQENRTGIEGLRGEVVTGFNNIWVGERGPWNLNGVHPILQNFSTPVYSHVTPRSWADALAALNTEKPEDDDASPPPEERVPVVVVKGPKRSGKSSLARASLNRLLDAYERVAWLECDLGQGEFGCGGTVGLWIIDQPVLGAPFTHPRVPEKAQYLGELSPQSCPDEYMAAIHQLFSHYLYEVQYPSARLGSDSRRSDVIPLVVNTQGWTKGLGEDIMKAIEAATEPTHIFAFETPEELQQREGWTSSPIQQTSELPYAAPWAGSSARAAAIFALEPAPTSPLQARYTAADMRALSTISYMHARLPEEQWDFTVPLLATRPRTVELGATGTLKHAYIVGEGCDAILEADLPLALNGSLVGLLADPSDEPEVYVPARRPGEEYTFLGLALVRAVRVESDDKLSLQLLTPLGGAELARVNAVARNGALQLPTAGMLDWREHVPGGGVREEGLAGTKWDDVPYFDAAGSEAIGGDRRRFRKNLQRKNQQG